MTDFPGNSNTPELKLILRDTLPVDVLDDNIEVVGSLQKWRGLVRCDLQPDQVDGFVRAYEQCNHETIKVANNKMSKLKDPSKSVHIFNTYYRCHHNTRHESTRDRANLLKEKPSRRFKNTNCPFSMNIKILRVTDVAIPPCTIAIEWVHNHNITNLEAFGHKVISDITIEKVLQYFTQGHTASTAYHEFMADFRLMCDSDLDFHLRKSDRSICPRRRDYNNLYAQFTRNMFGGRNGVLMFNELKKNLEFLEKKNVLSTWQSFDSDINQPLIVVLITPLMQRVHAQIPQSAELMFVDTTSNLEEHNLRFMLMCTHSVCGALPLGIIITSDEKEETIQTAFQMYNTILPENSFHGRKERGPGLIMTDNCDELRHVLRRQWPEARLLLCIYHVLQQVWRWLFDSDHGISRDDRQEVMTSFKKLLYSPDQEQFHLNFRSMQDLPSLNTYPNLGVYMNGLMARRGEWALCFRTEIPIRGSHTNNYMESQFLVLKDTILRRTRQFNINALISKITTDFERHFQQRLTDVSEGNFEAIYSRRFIGRNKKNKGSNPANGFEIPPTDVQNTVLRGINHHHENVNLFFVPSKTVVGVSYMVDMGLGRCECKRGSDGSPCFHQWILWSRNICSTGNFVPVHDPERRKLFAEVALGESLDISYYQPLQPIDQFVSTQKASSSTSCMATPGTIVTDADESRESSVNEKDVLCESAKKALDEISSILFQNATPDNVEFNKSVLKFHRRLKTLGPTRLNTSLNQFAGRLSRRKIATQPSSVSRRRGKSGSRQKQDTRGDNKKRNLRNVVLPNRLVRPSRPHSLVEAQRNNVRMAKKTSVNKMRSNQKHNTRVERNQKSE